MGVAEPLAGEGNKRSLDSLMGVGGSSLSLCSKTEPSSSSVMVARDSQGEGEQTVIVNKVLV